MSSPRASLALALLALAPSLFAGSYDRFPIPGSIEAKTLDVAAADTYVWVVPDQAGAVVSRAGTDGKVIETYPLQTLPAQRIALDPVDGGVWYANGYKVGHVALTGESVEFDLPFNPMTDALDIIVAPDDRIYVARTTDLVRVTRAGEATSLPLQGNGHSFDVTALAAGPDGNVWMLSHYGNAIGRLTPAGSFALFSNGAADADYPNGLTQGSDGNLWFTSNYGRLKKITTAGAITEVFPNAFASGTIVSGTDGRLWFGTNTTAISRYDIATNTVLSTHPVTQESGWIWPISAAASGVWWTGYNTILGHITYDGVAHDTTYQPIAPEPHAMASSAQHMWFVSPEENTIGRTNPADHTTALFALPHAGSRPIDIVAGPGGMWFTEETGDRIGRIDADGVITEFDILTPASKPTGIALGPDGNLWFTLAAADKVGRITPAGVVTEFPLPVAGSYPNSIVAGPDGNLWLTLRDRARVAKMTVAGAVTEYLADGFAPLEIVTAADGALWYATDDHTHRITTDGVVTSFARPGTIDQMIAGADGALWSIEWCCFRIIRTTLDGDYEVRTLPPGVRGFGIANGPEGKIWFSDASAKALYRMNQDDPLIATGQTFCHDQSGYFGALATFVDPVTIGTATDYMAIVDWGDHVDNPSTVHIQQSSPGHFAVLGSHNNSLVVTSVKVRIVSRPKAGSIGQSVVVYASVDHVTGTVNKTSFFAQGGSGAITITARIGCPWKVLHDAPWLTLPNGDSGTSSTSIPFTVAPNDTGFARSTWITVGETPIEITQLAEPAPGSSLYLVTPCRLYDTRDATNPIPKAATWELTAAEYCGIPADAQAIVANVTAVSPTTTGWLALYPSSPLRPGVSTMNYRAGRTRANNAIVPLEHGAFRVYNGGDQSIHFIIDVTGYFK